MSDAGGGYAAAGQAAGQLVGAMMQSSAARRAAAEQGRAAERSMQEEARQFDIAREDLAPWRRTGEAAVLRLSDLMGLTPSAPAGGYQWNGGSYADQDALRAAITANYVKESGGLDPNHPSVQDSIDRAMADIMRQQHGMSPADATASAPLTRRFTLGDLEADPVYQKTFQFGFDEGNKALSRTLRARGMFNSGAATKALTRFATDYAGSKAGDSYNRFTADQDRLYNRLAGVSGTGQTATTNTAQLGAQNASSASNLLTGAANARGAAAIGQANAWSGALGNIASTYQTQSILDQYRGGNRRTFTLEDSPNEYSNE